MELLVYFMLSIVYLKFDQAFASSCCPQKIVGGVAYQLVEEDENTSMHGCTENCVYTTVGGGDKYCFKEGLGSVQCFNNVTACIDSSNCKHGYQCDAVTNTCIKEKPGCREIQSRLIYPEGIIKTKNCFIYHCLPTNNTWATVDQDPSCCLVNGSLVPHGWTGTIGEAEGVCRNGSLEVGSRFLQEKIMENVTLTKDDLNLAFETYISICIEDAKIIQSSSEYFLNLMNKKGGECYDSIPTKYEGNDPGQPLLYYFDGQECKTISALPGQNTSNLFTSSYICEVLCVPRCKHKLLAGAKEDEQCTPTKKQTRWFWDGKRCTNFNYFGCNLNGNNFLVKEECQLICGGMVSDEKMPVQNSNSENDKFCTEYENEHPGIKKMIELTNDVKDPKIQNRLMNVMTKVAMNPKSVKTRQSLSDIDTLIEQIQSLLENGSNIEDLNDLLDQLGDLDSAFNSINTEVIPWLLEVGQEIPRRLWWSTVLTTNCSQTKIRIRYHCITNPVDGFNITDDLFDQICNDIIPAGLKAHYERSITTNGVKRELVIEPLRVPTYMFTKTFVIGESCNFGQVSGINAFLYLPTSVLVCKDFLSTYRFEETIGSVSAHELGHDILWTVPKSLEDGWRWSWFHKNTSSLTQPLPSAPKYPFPLSPGEELDLMFYYNTNPAISTSELTDMSIDRAKLAEEDAIALFENSLIRLNVSCEQGLCAPCVNDISCQAGLTCSLFRCSDCAQDSDCPSDQFCFGKILPWVCNECRPPQPDGAWCLEDSQCENMCSGGRCGPCKSHDDCPGDLYCRNLWLPSIPTYCSSPQPNGQICLESKECENSCSLGVCSECTKDSDCQDGEFCRNKLIPLVMNECSRPLQDGNLCAEDKDCVNNNCDGFVCGACSDNTDCAAGQYCQWKNIPLVQNKCKNVCGRSCLFNTNCGENGSECNRCTGGLVTRRCTK